jgi:hypothetical protein
MLFSSFPYDYPLLWTSEITPASYYDQLETHLRFVHASPPLISRILHIAITIGYSGFLLKLFKPSESNLLFDGSSLVLYSIGVIVYISNIVKGLRVVTEGLYDKILVDGVKVTPQGVDEGTLVNREDSLRVLAASNTILALVLVGVLVLQAGQWYAERKDGEEAAKFEEEKKEKAAEKGTSKNTHATRSASKKKQ